MNNKMRKGNKREAVEVLPSDYHILFVSLLNLEWCSEIYYSSRRKPMCMSKTSPPDHKKEF